MLPTKIDYPDFVPDQLLTSEDLNTLFRRLDEQGRLTRTNLIGIGIACGLELRTRADGTAITVTKGTGVTSEGYLVALDDAEYTRVVSFDASREIHYDKFVNAAGDPMLELWELKREAAVQDSTPLTLEFLNGKLDEDHAKVVLVFVELHRELDKNCNPESCDDKGQTVHVNLRVLLAKKIDVAAVGLDVALGSNYFRNGFANLPCLAQPRFDVPATRLASAAGIFSAYKRALQPSQIAVLGGALSDLWNLAKDDFGVDYGATNPFAGMADAFALLGGGPIDPADLLTLQYVYDHYSDLLAAYDEVRSEGMQALGVCCPDKEIFPRHLLLGSAIEDRHLVPLPLRHGFQASPIHRRKGSLELLESLFRRLVLMTRSFEVPPVQEVGGRDNSIRITPSRIGPESLSTKAMPWYYPAHVPTRGPFYTWWNHEKTRAGEPEANLGYHAPTYTSRDEVRRPLAYDLEPYNFVRIEGHVGKPIAHVLSNLQNRISRARLPVKVLALALGNDASGTQISDVTNLMSLHAQFESQKAEVLCCLREQSRYWAKLDIGDAFKKPGRAPDQDFLSRLKTAGGFPQVSLGAAIQMMYETRGVSRSTPQVAVTAAAAAKGATARLAANVAKGASVASGAASGVRTKKGENLVAHLGAEAIAGIGTKWLNHMVNGDVSLAFIPPPKGPVLDAPQLEHWALIILDQIQEIIVALEAENLLSLDVDTIETRRDSLVEALGKLSDLVDAHLEAQIPVSILTTYLGESYQQEAELIGAVMPGMNETDAHSMVRILLNTTGTETGISPLIHELGRVHGDLVAQRVLVEKEYKRIDFDSLMIPGPKEVVAENDPFFTQMRATIVNFTCLCELASFRTLRETLAKWIEQMKRLNLFGEFVKEHAGIQHKAGVPMGGTFILVYHRAPRAGRSKEAIAIANELGVEFDALDQGKLDPAIKRAAEVIEEGIVVADFYLPYICCSDQPPIQFQVLENASPTEEVSLVLEPNRDTGTLEYSVGDTGHYNFAPFPPGGTLDNAIPQLGVVLTAAGSWQFRPAMTADRLADEDTLVITFVYSKQDVASPEVSVTVHNLPEVRIDNASPRDRYTVGDEMLLTSEVVRADGLVWVIESPSGLRESVPDVPELAGYELSESGVYNFQLHATQSETGRVALSNRITIFAASDAVQPALSLVVNPDTNNHRYSVGDSNSYLFAYSPVGGELIGASAGAGVTKNDGGDHVFTPSQLAKRLGARELIDLEFRYASEGIQTDPVRVRVRALPTVVIIPEPNRRTFRLGETVNFNSRVERANLFTWSIVRPSGETTTRTGRLKLGPIALTEVGTWSVSLEAKQTDTGRVAVSEVATISVRRQGRPGGAGETRPPTVGNFAGVINGFDGLNDSDPAGFDLFRRRVLEAMGVGDLVLALHNLTNDSVETQLDTFRVGSNESWVTRTVGIMEEILEPLANSRSKVSKPLLTASYRALGNLVLYINSISGEDLQREQVASMNKLAKHVEGGRGSVSLENMGLDVSEMETVAAWKGDVEAALARQENLATGAVGKPSFKRQLLKLTKAF